MNTSIEYLYRDASNYKVFQSAVVKGAITEEQEDRILQSLNEETYFIPHLVGLPEKRFETWTNDDHEWFEFEGVELTEADATVDITIDELVTGFEMMMVDGEDRWESTLNDEKPRHSTLYFTAEKLQKAMQCLEDNGIEEDECRTVLQALGYILLDAELFPEDVAKGVLSK